MRNKAYSLVELIVVIAIILVLASAAVIGSQNIIKSLRLNNAFNKVVFMVQQARNLAITAKNTFATPVTQYEVRFYLDATTSPQKVEIFAKGPDQVMETYTFNAASGLSVAISNYINASPTNFCSTPTIIAFEQTTAKTNINCPGTTPPNTPILQIKVQGQNANQKTFLFQRGAGIPQVQ